jgi:hypothetical protein
MLWQQAVKQLTPGWHSNWRGESRLNFSGMMLDGFLSVDVAKSFFIPPRLLSLMIVLSVWVFCGGSPRKFSVLRLSAAYYHQRGYCQTKLTLPACFTAQNGRRQAAPCFFGKRNYNLFRCMLSGQIVIGSDLIQALITEHNEENICPSD